MASVIRIISEEASFCDQEFEAMLEALRYGMSVTYTPLDGRAEPARPHNFWLGADYADEGAERTDYRQWVMGDWADGRPLREQRFDTLRAEGKKLGEINAILEAEGYSEVFGEGVMPCPTKSHEIVRENKGARKMVETMGGQ